METSRRERGGGRREGRDGDIDTRQDSPYQERESLSLPLSLELSPSGFPVYSTECYPGFSYRGDASRFAYWRHNLELCPTLYQNTPRRPLQGIGV